MSMALIPNHENILFFHIDCGSVTRGYPQFHAPHINIQIYTVARTQARVAVAMKPRERKQEMNLVCA